MLENQQYRLAQRALVNLALHPLHGEVGPDTFQGLLDEHYITYESLRYLGVESGAPPWVLPHINQLITPTSTKPTEVKPLIIHTIGMPKTLKSILRDSLTGRAKYLTFDRKKILIHQSQEEAAGPLYEIYKRIAKEEVDFGSFALSQVLVNTIELEIFHKMVDPKIKRQVAILNRGAFDIFPFLRAHYLFGRLDEKKFSSAWENAIEGLKPLNNFHNAVLVLLTTPIESLRRNLESNNGEGRVMNSKFLPILYDQYVRYFGDLHKSSGRLANLDSPIAFAIIDMTTPNTDKLVRNYLTGVISAIEYYLNVKSRKPL